MNDWTTWWRGLSAPDRFRIYTRLALQVALLFTLASAAVGLIADDRGVWSVVGMSLAFVVGALAIEGRPELAGWALPRARRWMTLAPTVVLTATWACAALVQLTSTDDSHRIGARSVALAAVLIVALVLLPFLRHRWWVLLAASVANGLVFGDDLHHRIFVTVVTFALGAFVVWTAVATLWGLRLMDELERTKDVEAELQLAQERLRFSRDLHDVVGRGFSAVAVKSELAATLSRAGAADRAAGEMDEVKELAVRSMEEMRSLVRGYRDLDLPGEVAGARALLSAAGCRLDVEGDPATVPSPLHGVAAWAVREGTTNIVRHSGANRATLAFGTAGMSLRNDGVTQPPGERSGLQGLAERLDAAGASLRTRREGETFVLEIDWETA